jgi:hypothetical protein
MSWEEIPVQAPEKYLHNQEYCTMLCTNIMCATAVTILLLPANTNAQLAFCQSLLHQCAEDPAILTRFQVTDECSITKDSIMNFHN